MLRSSSLGGSFPSINEGISTSLSLSCTVQKYCIFSFPQFQLKKAQAKFESRASKIMIGRNKYFTIFGILAATLDLEIEKE